jgi:hypothetical protein
MRDYKTFCFAIRKHWSYPNLKFDTLVVPKDCLDLEVDAHGRDEGRSERVVGVAEQEGRFADAAVADDEQLEHVVKVLVRLVLLPPLVLHLRCVSFVLYLSKTSTVVSSQGRALFLCHSALIQVSIPETAISSPSFLLSGSLSVWKQQLSKQ